MNMNNVKQRTTACVSKLLASKTDDYARQLRVTRGGEVVLTDYTGSESMDGYAFRFETWEAGSGMCGEEAANCPWLVEKVLTTLDYYFRNPIAKVVSL